MSFFMLTSLKLDRKDVQNVRKTELYSANVGSNEKIQIFVRY